MIDIVRGLRRIAEEGYRFAGDAADEIERLRARLEAVEQMAQDYLRIDREKAQIAQRLEETKTAWKEADKACRDLTEKVIPNLRESLESAEKERDALRAKIEAMEKQEPAMLANSSNIVSARISRERGTVGDQHSCSETKTAYHDTPLYVLPGAKGE